MTWLYNGTELTDDMIPTKAVGFIYLMTQKSTGMKYLGRKMLTQAKTKTVKGKRKKIRSVSDLKDYWSSSKDVKDIIEQNGKEDFTREILQFISSKAEMIYAEEYCLYITNALLSDGFLNGNIRAKVMRSWFCKNKTDFIQTIEQLKIKLS